MHMADTEQNYYTVEQVSSLLQVHWQSVLNYIKRGDLEAIRIGRGYRISQQALNTFIANKSTKRAMP
jgi:excisionase family DNA binding protein